MDHRYGNIPAEVELVKKVLAGDRLAFAGIIKNTERLVAMILSKMIANRADHRDLAQDIYLRAFDKLDTFQFRSKLSTWIGQIAYHACLHYLEKRKLVLVDEVFTDGETALSPLEQLSNKSVSPFKKEGETLLIGKELKSILQAAIDRLPPVHRTLLSLYQAGMSNEEMAEITGLPEGTIKSYLFRARKKLKEDILSQYKKEDL